MRRFCLILCVLFMSWTNAWADSNEEMEPKSASSNVTTYGPDFFAQFENALTVVDIIKRIPGGQAILNSSSNNNNRGFSTNDDHILINGKRLAAKNNGSIDALSRIALSQVERIEIIHGSSPDVKTKSQEAIINIVTNETTKGAGTWEVLTRLSKNLTFDAGGKLSYGASIGNFDYVVSAETTPNERLYDKSESFYEDLNGFLNRLDEVVHRTSHYYSFTANTAYNFKGGQILHINALYQDSDKENNVYNGMRYTLDSMEQLVPSSTSIRFSNYSKPTWEFGGDFTTDLGSKLKLQIIGLYSHKTPSFSQSEDNIITPDNPAVDFLFTDQEIATEAIGRASLTWNANGAHTIEFGTEQTFNTLDVDLEYFQNDGFGNLEEIDIPFSHTMLKEVRNESFIIDTWKISEKTSFEAQVYLETFSISQDAITQFVKRNFSFVRPSFTLRHNLGPRDQLQISIQRKIAQLDFRDFSSNTSDDDEVIAGNLLLEPQKQWDIEGSMEHRFDNDQGRIKLTLIYSKFSDLIERIEILPGISGVGNIGSGREIAAVFNGSLRLGFLGLPNVLLEGYAWIGDSRVTDPFTGEVRPFNFYQKSGGNLRMRHDLNKWGLSYGLFFFRNGQYYFHDIDEVLYYSAQKGVEVFIEKHLFGSIKLNLTVSNLATYKNQRERFLYADGVVSDIVTGRAKNNTDFRRLFIIKVQGTF